MVVQDRAVRLASPTDAYQGVWFKQAVSPLQLGVASTVVLELIYSPDVSYADLQPGATFTVREGARVVAHGVVLPPEAAD